MTDENQRPPDDASSREALEKEIRALRKQVERSEHYRRRTESLKEQNDLFLRNVINDLRATQDKLEETKAELERRVDERTQELRRANAELQRQVGERDRLNVELAAARDAAVASDRAKSAFLATMSHELRTPLNVIIGYAELVGEMLSESEVPEVGADVERIRGAAEHLLTIINDILDLAKIESGNVTVLAEDIDILALVTELAATMQPLVVRGANHLTVTVEPGLGALRTDRRKLRQTLYNLLGNACKFTAGGQIELSVRRDGPCVAFAVRDTGIGIPAAQIGALFEAFTQVDSSPTRRHSGTGLGLAICRRFAQMLGGSITVDSREGEGSTFTVRLPA